MTPSIIFLKISRVKILRRLVEVQKEIDIQLITSEEISGIQWIWYHDFHDASGVTKIYEEVYGEELVMNKKINERRHNLYHDIDMALKTYLKTQEIQTA